MDNRYFFETCNLFENLVTIKDNEASHLTKVRRANIGDQIVAFCGDGYDYKLKIIAVSKAEVKCEVIEKSINSAYKKDNITVYLSMLKNDALTTSIDNLAELNVTHVKLFKSDFSVANIDQSKLGKLNNISIQASKQSERADIMTVEIIKKEKIETDIMSYNNRFFAYEDATITLKEKSYQNKSFALIIGPEGGFSSEEAEYFSKFSDTITLGYTILRAEVACVSAVSSIKAVLS